MTKEKAFPVKIGLEVHGYLNTREKLFCMCRAQAQELGDRGQDLGVNDRICPICTGTPGSKPMGVNGEAVRKMVEVALILSSRISVGDLVWQRKHYSWADLPKGYQNTISGPHSMPCAIGGKFRGINIIEAHLEEDPAQWNPDNGKINYNRSGLPLIEIVTEPEFSDAEQVVEWLKNLVLSLSYVKAVRKNAGIKVDVNVSTYGERVEMKNLNSLEKIRKAIEYEIARQSEIVESMKLEVGSEKLKELLPRETRMFDEKSGTTIKMRSKEGVADYRFIPEPDLPVLRISKKLIEEVRKSLPEMPEVKLERLLKKFKVSESDAKILTGNLELVEFFEALVEIEKGKISIRTNTDKHGFEKMVSWVTVELLRVLNYNRKTLEDEDVEILPEHLAELIGAVSSGKITVLKAKQIMNDFMPRSFSISEGNDVGKIGDDAIENLCRQVVDENSHVVDEFRNGKLASLNYLIGQVMRLSERRAGPDEVREILKKMVGKSEVD
ncbi:MAG: Asp-tRNA(Asn)/Glu-tRNA(Gln) amidotransferase subunit GatB [archaeon]